MTYPVSEKLFLPVLNCEETLTSIQLQTSQLFQSLCAEATSLTSILTLMTGQTVASFARSGSFKLLSYCFGNGGKKIAAYHYASSMIACAAEGIAFNTATEVGRTGHFQIGTWEENLHGFLTLGVCKILAGKSGNSLILQHGIQDGAMVTVDVACEGLGLIEKREEGFIQRMSGAELASFRMGISAKLTHLVCVDVSHFNAKQDLDYAFRRSRTREVKSTERGWMTEKGWGLELATANGAAVENRDLFSSNSENSPWKKRGWGVFAMSAYDQGVKSVRATLKSSSATSPLGTAASFELFQSPAKKRLLMAKMYQAFLNSAKAGEDTSSHLKDYAKTYLENHPDLIEIPEEQRRKIIPILIRDSLVLFPERVALLLEHNLEIPLIRATAFVNRPQSVKPVRKSHTDLIRSAEKKLRTLTDFYGFEVSSILANKVLKEVPILAEYVESEKVNVEDKVASARAVQDVFSHEKPWVAEWVSLFYFYRGESDHHLAITFGTARLLRKIGQAVMSDKGFSKTDHYSLEAGKSICNRKQWRELVDRYAPANLYSDITRKRLARSYIATHFPELPIWKLPYYEEGSFFEEYEAAKVAKYFADGKSKEGFKRLGIRFFFARNKMDLSSAEFAVQNRFDKARYDRFEANDTYPPYQDLLNRSRILGIDFRESLLLLLQTHLPDLVDPETGHPRLKREPIYMETRGGDINKVRRYIENPGSPGEDLFWDRKNVGLTLNDVAQRSRDTVNADRLAHLEENFSLPKPIEIKILASIYGTDTGETVQVSTGNWEVDNKIEQINRAITGERRRETFYDLFKKMMNAAGLIPADLYRDGAVDKCLLQEIRREDRKPRVETLYRLIALIQERSCTDHLIDPADFYEAYQTDLSFLPFYDPSKKAYQVSFETAAQLKEAVETPLATYLSEQLGIKKLKKSELAVQANIPMSRMHLILRGQTCFLDLPEIIGLARVLEVGVDEMFLRVHKELKDFSTVISSRSGKVLKKRNLDFRNQVPPDSYKPPLSPFAETLLRLQEKWEITMQTEMAKRLNIPPSTLKSYLAGIKPPLPVFYGLCQTIERSTPAGERIPQRVSLYLAYASEAIGVKVLDERGRKIILQVPEDEIDQWNYEKFQQTSFSWLISQIETSAIQRGFTSLAFAAQLKENRGMIISYKEGKIIEIRWDFIRKLAEFTKEHLGGKYHPSFIAAVARPEIFDLAKTIVNQRGEKIYEPEETEPLNFEERYRERLKTI